MVHPLLFRGESTCNNRSCGGFQPFGRFPFNVHHHVQPLVQYYQPGTLYQDHCTWKEHRCAACIVSCPCSSATRHKRQTWQSITGQGWNKKQHLPKKTGSMREFKCSHICAFTPTTSLPSSAAFLQVKMKTTLMLLLVMLEANLATITINMTEKAKILFSNLRQRAP